jgi:heparanase 1
MRIKRSSPIGWTMLFNALTLALLPGVAIAQATFNPQKMIKIGDVDPRFVSYNVEAVEVTGGRFWKPYNDEVEARLAGASQTKPGQNQPIGMDPNLFQYRPPIDLSNTRLRKLAKALEPAYLRVSGTWRNSTYFQDNDEPAMQSAPKGFNGVLTRAQWKGVVDFSHAVGADILTSVATSVGTRDSNGIWTPEQAKAIFDYTEKIGGHIAATEFMNEPTLP